MAKYCCPFCKKESWRPDYTIAMFKWAWDICESVGWNRALAADMMGVSHRTVRNWVRKWKAAGYTVPDSKPESYRKAKYARQMR
jgi:transposase